MQSSKIYKLSNYFSNWNKIKNDNGISPSLDLAHTDKFQINDNFYQTMFEFYQKYKNTAQYGQRSLTIRNIEEIEHYLRHVSNIEEFISNKVGEEFILHPMKSELYLYNLTPPLKVQKNIDNWHYDYMPFVLVYMIEKSHQSSGNLILDINGDFKKINLGVGEGIFMQGSQIKHLAKRCVEGNRTTLVLSFIPKNILIPDNTYITRNMEPYHKNENLSSQYREYKLKRIEKLKNKLKYIMNDNNASDDDHNNILKALKEEERNLTSLV